MPGGSAPKMCHVSLTWLVTKKAVSAIGCNGCTWVIFGLYLGYIWVIFGFYLGFIWVIFGLYLGIFGYIWVIFGLYLGYI